jgi:hypothetical protein
MQKGGRRFFALILLSLFDETDSDFSWDHFVNPAEIIRLLSIGPKSGAGFWDMPMQDQSPTASDRTRYSV